MKHILASLLLICFLITNINVVKAADTSDVDDVSKLYAIMVSEDTKEIIGNSIDFNKYGIQNVDFGNGLSFKYESKKMEKLTLASTWKTVSDTMSGTFYKTSNNQTVARYSLAVTFQYNGSSVKTSDDNIQVSCSSIPNWSVVDSYSISYPSSGCSVDATFDLYYDNQYNNQTFLDMACNVNGTITKTYE